MTELPTLLAAIERELPALRQLLPELEAAYAAASHQARERQSEYLAAKEDLLDAWSQRFAVRSIKPLSPEQLVLSWMQAGDVIERNRQDAVTQIEAVIPAASVAGDPVRQAERAYQIELKLREKLEPSFPGLVGLYGAAAGQPQDDFFATADQALYALNAGTLDSWLWPQAGNGTEKALQAPDPVQQATEVYLAVLNRLPSPNEVTEFANLMAVRNEDRARGILDFAWGLAASAEFRFHR